MNLKVPFDNYNEIDDNNNTSRKKKKINKCENLKTGNLIFFLRLLYIKVTKRNFCNSYILLYTIMLNSKKIIYSKVNVTLLAISKLCFRILNYIV